MCGGGRGNGIEGTESLPVYDASLSALQYPKSEYWPCPRAHRVPLNLERTPISCSTYSWACRSCASLEDCDSLFFLDENKAT